MSGLEVIGAASSVLALLESVCGVVSRFRKAYERQQNAQGILGDCEAEISSTTTIVRIVEKEAALQTAAVAADIDRIKSVGRKLQEFFIVLDPSASSRLRQFTNQLMHGSSNEKKLTDLNALLRSAKTNLGLSIQVANVGLTSNVDNKIVANTEIIARIDAMLQGVFGEGRGLKIAEILRNRFSTEQGSVPLEDEDVAALKQTSDSAEASSRVVLDNVTKDQALQINGPLGERGWREAAHLEIRQNHASDRSIQVNHAISEEMFLQLLKARAAG